MKKQTNKIFKKLDEIIKERNKILKKAKKLSEKDRKIFNAYTEGLIKAKKIILNI